MPAKAGIHDSIRKRTGCLAGEIDPSLRWGDGAGDDCFPPNAIMLRLLWHPSDGVASLREMLDRVAVDGDPGVLAFLVDRVMRRRELGIGEGAERDRGDARSEEHTSELQSLMRNSYAVFCLKKKKKSN